MPSVNNFVACDHEVDPGVDHTLSIITAGGPVNINAFMFIQTSGNAFATMNLGPVAATFGLVTVMLVVAFAGLAGFVFRRATSGPSECEACAIPAEATPVKPAKDIIEVNRDVLDVSLDPFKEPESLVKRKSGV